SGRPARRRAPPASAAAGTGRRGRRASAGWRWRRGRRPAPAAPRCRRRPAASRRRDRRRARAPASSPRRRRPSRARAASARAAAQLSLTQPALSRQIRDLESELGLPLFDRVGRRLHLTAEGENLLERTREILRAADALRERAGALAGGRTGTLRLGATAQTLESLISAFLTGFRRAWPGIEVRKP